MQPATYGQTKIGETSIAALVGANQDGIACEEKYDCGWMTADPLHVPARIKTIARKHPAARVVVFGDETIGIEIEGKIWALEQPHPERSICKRRLPREDWQWLNFASDHAVHDGIRWVNFGDDDNLRKA